MQLGSRWQAGDAPHPGVPELLHAAIRLAEAECPDGHSWTLTWLEGRPRVELLDAQAALLRDIGVTAQGEVKVAAQSAHNRPGNSTADPLTSDSATAASDDDDDDDDDDWLN